MENKKNIWKNNGRWKITKPPKKSKNIINIEKQEVGTDQKLVKKFMKYVLGHGSNVLFEESKGQLISKCSFIVIIATKICMYQQNVCKDFFPRL